MTIYGRVDILNQIVTSTNFLINLSGEPGIGKTAVLNEAKERIEAHRPAPRVILIDFKTFCDAESHAVAFLRELYRQVHGKIPGHRGDLDRETARMVNHLNEKGPFILMFDSTEVLQDVQEFWKWLVKDLLGPLSSTDQVRVVIAGRVNALLFDYRLNNKLLIKLEVLTKERGSPAEMMVQNLLKASPLILTEAELTSLCNLICNISLGHPDLIKRLVENLERHYRKDGLEQLRSSFCQRDLLHYTKDTLLSGIRDSWKEILWWASPLREFDRVFLSNYLKLVAPNLAGLIPPETNPAPSHQQWFQATHDLEIRGIGRKEPGVVIPSECMQHFLYQSMLYQSILEPESPGLFQALQAVIDVSLNEANSNHFADDAASNYRLMAQEYQEKLCSAYQEAIQILNRLAEESQQDAPAFKDYTAKAKLFEAACRQNCSGNPGEVAL